MLCLANVTRVIYKQRHIMREVYYKHKYRMSEEANVHNGSSRLARHFDSTSPRT